MSAASLKSAEELLRSMRTISSSGPHPADRGRGAAAVPVGWKGMLWQSNQQALPAHCTSSAPDFARGIDGLIPWK